MAAVIAGHAEAGGAAGCAGLGGEHQVGQIARHDDIIHRYGQAGVDVAEAADGGIRQGLDGDAVQGIEGVWVAEAEVAGLEGNGEIFRRGEANGCQAGLVESASLVIQLALAQGDAVGGNGANLVAAGQDGDSEHAVAFIFLVSQKTCMVDDQGAAAAGGQGQGARPLAVA